MAATIPWPSDDPGVWEVLYLGGVIFPGLAKTKVSGGQKIDTKDAPGSDGESTTQQGEKAKTIDIVLRLWTREQWNEYEDAHARIEPPIGKRTPLDIVTGLTAFRLITAMLVETIDGPDWNEDKTWMEISIKGKEHKPPPPKPATKPNTGSSSAYTGVLGIFQQTRDEVLGNTGVTGIFTQTRDNVLNPGGSGKPRKTLVAGDDDGVVLTKARKSSQTVP